MWAVRSRVAGLLLAGLLAADVEAEVYHWVDDQGVIHYTTGIESVPERYRPTARVMASSGAEAPPSESPAIAGGGTTIPFTPGAPIMVSARINGDGAVSLILDTGAERTLVAPAALARLGVATPNTYEATIQGVTGAVRADVVWIQSLEVGGSRAGPLPIIAHDAEISGADGLLGRDFLSLFSVTIDTRANVVTLEPN
jgi:predicted aspartyl protease